MEFRKLPSYYPITCGPISPCSVDTGGCLNEPRSSFSSCYRNNRVYFVIIFIILFFGRSYCVCEISEITFVLSSYMRTRLHIYSFHSGGCLRCTMTKFHVMQGKESCLFYSHIYHCFLQRSNCLYGISESTFILSNYMWTHLPMFFRYWRLLTMDYDQVSIHARKRVKFILFLYLSLKAYVLKNCALK